MYTVCYVLTDSDSLQYYNELLISLASLRKRGFQGKVVVLTDEKTGSIIEKQARHELDELCADYIIVDIPARYSQKEKSRYIKTSMREYIKGDFLYIDTDTIIADALPETVSDCDLALVKDAHGTMIEAGIVNHYQALFKKCDYPFDASGTIYNSGVIWCKDTAFTHTFFRRWHDEWNYSLSRGVVFDQPSLNKLSVELGGAISELDGRYNVQISYPLALQYLSHAYIIHCFNDVDHSESAYSLQQPEIKQLSFQSDRIRQIIESPKDAFIPCRLVKLDGVEDQLSKTEAYRILRVIYQRKKKAFHLLETTLKARQEVSRALQRLKP